MTRRVLVVDGNAEVRNVIEDLLFDQGFAVRQAANPDDALLALREDAPDVLLCHLTLLRSRRGMLTRRVRELWPTLRIVAMSASGAQPRSDEASASLSKPFTRLQLLDALRPR
jgi:two-component system nitrogen regulation response regulator NtrX